MIRRLLLLLLLCACDGSPSTTGKAPVCTITYERLNGEDSLRVDELRQVDAVIKRLVRSKGTDVTSAIYYRYDVENRRRRAEFDLKDDSSIDGWMERTKQVGPGSLWMIDADVSDKLRDTSQISVTLPGADIGLFQPSRILYGLPCQTDNITLTQSGDSMVVDAGTTNMVLTFSGDRLVNWAVGANETAELTYDSKNRITEVVWKKSADPYLRVKYAYANGQLVRYGADDKDDGTEDHIIHYGTDCAGF